MSITKIGKLEHIKHFENIDDFNKYYAKHKEEIDKKTTNQLNKEYTITGYKICKRGIKTGEVTLHVIKNKLNDNKLHEVNEPNEEYIKLRADVDELKTKMLEMCDKVNELIDLVNS